MATKSRLLFKDGRVAAVGAFYNELMPGRYVGLEYSDDPGIWHEALLVYPSSEGYVILTPDGDSYDEDVSCSTGQGPRRAFLFNDNGEPPPRLDGNQYRFRVRPSASELLRLIRVEVRAANGIGMPDLFLRPGGGIEPLRDAFAGPPRRLGKKSAELPLTPEAPRRGKPLGVTFDIGTPDGVDEGALDTPVPEKGPKRWVAAETRGGIEKGTEIKFGKADLRIGDRGVHVLPSGESLCVMSAADLDAGEEDAGLDNRVLDPVVFDPHGVRFQSFDAAVGRMKEEPLEDFPLRNRRSLMWLLTYVKSHGMTFDGRQTKWSTEQKIDPESVTYVMHDLVGYALELGATYDQLDLPNLASFELLGRLYQMIEETKGSLNLEGFDHFVGRDPTAGIRRGVALAPALAGDAIAEQAKETEILKQRRKAREERALSSAAGGKGGKKGDKKQDP